MVVDDYMGVCYHEKNRDSQNPWTGNPEKKTNH